MRVCYVLQTYRGSSPTSVNNRVIIGNFVTLDRVIALLHDRAECQSTKELDNADISIVIGGSIARVVKFPLDVCDHSSSVTVRCTGADTAVFRTVKPET